MATETTLSAADRELFRDNFRKFLQNEVEPHYEKWEKAGIVPRELYLKMGEAGLLCVDVPEEYGGAGAPLEFSFAIAEESARLGYMSLCSNVMMHSDIVAPYILHLGSEAQKRKYLPKMISGQCFGALAMTEPGAGTDLQAIKTTASAACNQVTPAGPKCRSASPTSWSCVA